MEEDTQMADYEGTSACIEGGAVMAVGALGGGGWTEMAEGSVGGRGGIEVAEGSVGGRGGTEGAEGSVGGGGGTEVAVEEEGDNGEEDGDGSVTEGEDDPEEDDYALCSEVGKDLLDYAEDDSFGEKLYQHIERRDYESLAERKRKAASDARW